MTVSLQYIHRIYGDRLRKVERSTKPQETEPQAKKEQENDVVLISKTDNAALLSSEGDRGMSGSILQTKLAIRAYQNVAKGMSLMLR
ncbi:MAG: hypothetical protein JW941_11800 [Candidatus Coatesbacteria bacterium]|nr:hypothetical protein [Candidatus Coatesbacteria bacterium]